LNLSIGNGIDRRDATNKRILLFRKDESTFSKRSTHMNRYTKIIVAALSTLTFASISFSAIPAGYAGTPYPPGHAPREIPGRINFHDYDCGGLNVAFYADDRAGEGSWGGTPRKDDGATSWPAFYMTNTPWDHDTLYPAGVSYPNGVYYPNPKDTSVHDLYIGASHGNSWTKWTVHVAKAGKYWISSIFSAADQPAHFAISFLNGTKTTTVQSGNLTGVASYHSWKQFNDFASITLDTGVQVLYFQNATGHLNQDFIYFSADSGKGITAVAPSRAVSEKTFDLSISASPDNVSKTVRFTLSGAGMTTISVINPLGQAVMTVARQNLAAGTHSTQLDARRLGHGMYLLQIEQNGVRQSLKFQH
jgi:hypothetical protein